MSESGAVGDRAGSPIVLVVDDNELVLTATCELLAEAGFAVRQAINADQALGFLSSCLPPSMVITDISMPGDADGIALANTIHERWPEVRVVLVSGMARPEAEKYPEAALFLTKPFPARALITIVENAVGNGDLFT